MSRFCSSISYPLSLYSLRRPAALELIGRRQRASRQRQGSQDVVTAPLVPYRIILMTAATDLIDRMVATGYVEPNQPTKLGSPT